MTRCQPNLGNDVNVCGVCQEPALKWNCRLDKLYTVFLIDLYPLGEANPKLLSQGILWWVVNVPGCNVSAGLTGYAYQKPLPLYGAGKGIYVALVYEQPPYDVDWTDEDPVNAT